MKFLLQIELGSGGKDKILHSTFILKKEKTATGLKV